jgi:hypothetical protein
VIAVHAWPGGFAVEVEGAASRSVGVFGPDGWRRGEPREVLPDGPPAGAHTTTLEVPDWLADQLAPRVLTLGGVHTDFIRLDRLLNRMRAQDANGAVVVLGERPAVVVATDGHLQVVERPARASAPAAPGDARGWILQFSGRIMLPADVSTSVGVVPLRPAATARHPAAIPERSAHAQPPAAAPSSGERFVVASSVAQSPPDDVVAAIAATAGDAAVAALAHLDGSRTLDDVAALTGLSNEQLTAVVRLLVERRLAFRYVSRTRPATGVQTRR